MNPEDPSLKETAILPRDLPWIFEKHAGICPTCAHDFTNPPAPLNPVDGELVDRFENLCVATPFCEAHDAARQAILSRLAALRQEAEGLKSEKFLLQRKLDIALDEYEKRVEEHKDANDNKMVLIGQLAAQRGFSDGYKGERDAMRKALESALPILTGEAMNGHNPNRIAAGLARNQVHAALAHPVSAPEVK